VSEILHAQNIELRHTSMAVVTACQYLQSDQSACTFYIPPGFVDCQMIQDTLELSIILNAIFTSAGCLASGAKIGYMALFFDPYAKTTSLVILLIFLR
jgi:hypothetical protein